MDKKKVKELIREVIHNNVDSLEFGNDKHNASLRKANTLLHDALIELSKSDWIPVEDEPAPRLEWNGSWNDIVVCYKDKWALPLSYVVRNDVEFTHWRRIEKLEE